MFKHVPFNSKTNICRKIFISSCFWLIEISIVDRYNALSGYIQKARVQPNIEPDDEPSGAIEFEVKSTEFRNEHLAVNQFGFAERKTSVRFFWYEFGCILSFNALRLVET